MTDKRWEVEIRRRRRHYGRYAAQKQTFCYECLVLYSDDIIKADDVRLGEYECPTCEAKTCFLDRSQTGLCDLCRVSDCLDNGTKYQYLEIDKLISKCLKEAGEPVAKKYKSVT